MNLKSKKIQLDNDLMNSIFKPGSNLILKQSNLRYDDDN